MKTPRLNGALQRSALLGLALLMAVSLSACLKTFSLTLKPKPDGSGTMEYMIVLKEETLQMIKEMKDDTSNTSENKTAASGLEAQARMTADSSGGIIHFETIRYIVRHGDTIGANAIFRFDDITKINPKELFKSQSSLGQSDDDTSAQVWSKFEFTKGSPSLLRVHSRNAEKMAEFGGLLAGNSNDQGTKKKKGKAEKEPENPFAEMFASALDSLEMNLAIEPQGTIESTNSTKRVENRLTFAHIDLSGLLAMVKAKSKNPKLAAKLEKQMHDAMWIEKTPVVDIRFGN